MHKRSISLVVMLCGVLVSAWPVGSRWGHDDHNGQERTVKKHRERTIEDYKVPRVTLVNQHGQRVDLQAVLQSDKPVLLNFVFTTCTTVCPLLSAAFAHLQQQLGPETQSVQMVSLSIDPEHDTPEVLRAYSQRYGAQPGWEFLTGKRQDIDQVMKAFNAELTNKMGHYPLTFLRAPGSDRWVRVYGLMGTSDLMKEYRELLKQ